MCCEVGWGYILSAIRALLLISRPAGLFRNSYCIHVSILRAVRKRVSVLVNLFKCMRARKDVAANPGVDFCAFLGHQTGLITHAVRP